MSNLKKKFPIFLNTKDGPRLEAINVFYDYGNTTSRDILVIILLCNSITKLFDIYLIVSLEIVIAPSVKKQ